MELIGTSPSIQKVKNAIDQVATTTASVLLLGESGTGKELVAQIIHGRSKRHDSPFVPVNCGAIPSELLESELFGHEKGAFTGALTARQGRFEIANQGTIFLDEIGDMPISMQVKILRVLQEHSFERIGSTKSINTDIRVIAATNKNLEREITAGNFREDLYYRLNVFPIVIPPLRERREDIPLLINHFLAYFNQQNDVNCCITDEALAKLIQYQWPGNVRELANIVERLSIQNKNKAVELYHLPSKIYGEAQTDTSRFEKFSHTIMVNHQNQGEFKLKNYLQEIEISLIHQALNESGGVVSKAASKLGIRRTTLVEKIKKYNIRVAV